MESGTHGTARVACTPLLVLLALALSPTPVTHAQAQAGGVAQANDNERPPPDEDKTRSGIGWTVDSAAHWSEPKSEPGMEATSVFSMDAVLRGRFRVGREWSLDTDLPLMIVREQHHYEAPVPQTNEQLLYGLSNPTVTLIAPASADGNDSRIGLGIALPLRGVDEPLRMRPAAARGMWNLWWHDPIGPALFLPFDIRSRSGRWDMGLEGAFAFRTTLNLGPFALGYAAQLGGWFSWGDGPFDLGLRTRTVLFNLLVTEDEDGWQSSVEPFVEAQAGRLSLGAGLVLNIDGPGASFRSGGVWGLRFQVGMEH